MLNGEQVMAIARVLASREDKAHWEKPQEYSNFIELADSVVSAMERLGLV